MDKILYQRLQNTLLLSEDVKQDLLKYFEKLSEKQIKILSELLQAENILLLNFLRKQKDNGNIPVYALKEKYIEYRKKQHISMEAKEILEEQEDLDNLLLELD